MIPSLRVGIDPGDRLVTMQFRNPLIDNIAALKRTNSRIIP